MQEDSASFSEEELKELEEAMEMLETMEVVNPHMSKEDLEELKRKHRASEDKAIMKANMEYLKDMIKHERPTLLNDSEEPALFISLQHKRLSIRSIQYMISKYEKNRGLTQKLTPHKLRRTYGTALYNKTSDIYMVADVLGHKDVNTTVKHYAAIEEEHKRQASQVDVYAPDPDEKSRL